MSILTPDTRATSREQFAALNSGGLDWNCLPLRLYAKGNKRFWNAADIDLTRDAEDWAGLTPDVQYAFTSLSAMFLAGEEAVTRDLQPFLSAMAAEGRFADEMYLTQFTFEEARHVEAFRRWLDAVGVTVDLNAFVTDNPGHREIFCEALPEALDRLLHDPSPANQVRASITYNHVVEGTLALTGYHAWSRFCKSLGLFPGMQQIIRLIGDDERRHMAWGTFTCRRHVAADASNWAVASERMAELVPFALRSIGYAARYYPPGLVDLPMSELVAYGRGRARRRLSAIESALRADVRSIESEGLPEALEDRFAAEDQARAARREARAAG